MLYQIWAHFVPEAPWSGVARVLLSRLCRQVGYEMYEMDIAVRNLLLRELKKQFGQERLDELADFLIDYMAQIVEDADDCIAIQWLNQPYREETFQPRSKRISIHRSYITGLTGQSNRLWHRMYPIVHLVKDPDDPNKPIAKKTPKYLEILTFFPDNSLESNEFLHLLNSEKSFEKLYP